MRDFFGSIMIIDAHERECATDPLQSFIVQAPAGSGKTEILTQRYLRLLSRVHEPENIIALTFTRKAAYEMRARILHALHQTDQGVPPTSAHQATTQEYARAALARDRSLNWQLLQQPSRLRIMTIDALCQTLHSAIPLHDQPLHHASVSDQPYSLYQEAALACIEHIHADPTYHAAFKILLRHLDNRQDHLLNLFRDLLSQRDQWLPIIYQARTQNKALFEQAIAWIEQHELTRFRRCLPDDLAATLISLARRVALLENDPHSKRYPLHTWQSLDELDGHRAASLAALLLTTQKTLRKSFDHHVGFRRDSCSSTEYTQLKAASKELLEQLNNLPDFIEALLRIQHLPEPAYDSSQWRVLQALFTLLPLLVAHAQLTFQTQHRVDFIAIAQQALLALGDEQAPTDLALYLDHHIQHLLIDEFQDTSWPQFQLLQLLVQGWEAHDARTLFIVGDPMQSIYRFRAAEVGLFLRARQHGVGPVTLTPLELRCNFRSTATIVHWVNNAFKHIFPAVDDMESGAISYLEAAAPFNDKDVVSTIEAYQFSSRQQEAHALVVKIQEELAAHPHDTIAILVRSRHQLPAIMRILKEHHIPFQGVDIDKLSHLPHIRDVWTLTQALLMPAHRLAWLSFLRSPWCGLSLDDLHVIANIEKKKSIYTALQQTQRLTALSPEGQTRVQFIMTVLHNALTQRHQHTLVDWLIQTVQHLHIQHILTRDQQEELEQYWLLLDRFDNAGYIDDLNLFQQELNQLYSKKVMTAQVQIMTIHKSKGLEFDTVILPGLGASSRDMKQPLLRWLQLPSQEHGDLFLLSPVKAASETHDALYHYLAKIDAEKNHYEMQRLLYVAVTRAKKRLYLFDHHLKVRQNSPRALLKNQIFQEEEDIMDELPSSLHPTLYRLPLEFYQHAPVLNPQEQISSLQITLNTARLLGIIAHELLQWICTYHPQDIEDIPWHMAEDQFKTLGFDPSEQQQALDTLQKQLHAMWADPLGQWIIQHHEDEHNEYELLMHNDHNDVITQIIDRTFIENGHRWIIDFKTGHEDEKKHEQHKKQLEAYAQLFQNDAHTSVRCGIYYLSSCHWVTWQSYVHSQKETHVLLG